MGIKKRQYFSELFRKYLENRSSSKEVEALFDMLAIENHEAIKSAIDDVLHNETTETDIPAGAIDETLQARLQMIMQEIDKPSKSVARISPLQWRWAAAAAVFVLAISVFFYSKLRTTPIPVEIAVKEQPITNDVPAPAAARAILKLDDGTVVYLDSAKNGSLAVQGNVSVTKNANGEIAYSGMNSEMLYNTLINPRGSQVVTIFLSDGTKVWLNAESSIHYPAAFSGSERRVEVTGEAYFEVAHNASMPFFVSRNKMEVKVLGTHFNVNAYDDEASVKITLVEGSVKVSNNASQFKVLKPNQQAELMNNSIAVNNNVNTDEVTAWKNGKFQFTEKINIQTVMRQIARWYDVEVNYEGEVSQHFWGSISRDINVSQVLNKLESTGGVRFRIEGKKVIVMP